MHLNFELRLSGRVFAHWPEALNRQRRHYFLSRPRRFGKSLLLDTLRELFAGNEPLFRSLAIHGNWDWSDSHPVVRLSFDGSRCNLLALRAERLDSVGT